jgi:hypothetical protein
VESSRGSLGENRVVPNVGLNRDLCAAGLHSRWVRAYKISVIGESLLFISLESAASFSEDLILLQFWNSTDGLMPASIPKFSALFLSLNIFLHINGLVPDLLRCIRRRRAVSLHTTLRLSSADADTVM